MKPPDETRTVANDGDGSGAQLTSRRSPFVRTLAARAELVRNT